MTPQAKTKRRRRAITVPSACPKCRKPIRKFRRVEAQVRGKAHGRSEPAHLHLTFAGACSGTHLHICDSCGATIKTLDPTCDWHEPQPLVAGWDHAKASQCDYEDAQLVELPKTATREDETSPSR